MLCLERERWDVAVSRLPIGGMRGVVLQEGHGAGMTQVRRSALTTVPIGCPRDVVHGAVSPARWRLPARFM